MNFNYHSKLKSISSILSDKEKADGIIEFNNSVINSINEIKSFFG